MLTHDYKPTLRSHTLCQATQCNRTDQSLPKSMTAQPHGVQESTGYNSSLAIGGVSSPLDSFEVAESSVLRTNFCAEKPAHRQAANR